MALKLSFILGPLAGTHVVTSARMIRLGRDPAENDILLPNPALSRRHAIIERAARGGYMLVVTGSGPTSFNGDPIVASGGPVVTPLSNGDRIDLGGVEVLVHETDVKLVVVMGMSAGRELTLDGPCRIGADRACDLALLDGNVAAEHLTIEATPLGFRATAKGKTLFNGVAAEARVLAHGDELVIGGAVLRVAVAGANDFSDEPATMSTALPPAPVANAVGELVVISGAGKGLAIPLGDAQIILGTAPDCTTVLSDPAIGPMHCAISPGEGGQFVATDLGSPTGTYVNGVRITGGTPLAPGDLLGLGGHVLEARLLGGVPQATKGISLFTSALAIGGGAAAALPQPRFVVEGRVVNAARLAIGRAPNSDVIVDAPEVSRVHCTLEWTGAGFSAVDGSRIGTYVDDRRIVSIQLPPSCVLRIHDTMFRVSVRGELCTIERADALLARAAVDVARARATAIFQVGQVEPPPAAAAAPAAAKPGKTAMVQVPGAFAEGALKTIFRMDAGDLEQQIVARKREVRKSAPAWRPSSDLKRDRVLRGAILVATLAAAALCAGMMFVGRGRALVNHPLSPAHSTRAFADAAKGVTACGACHTAGATVAAPRCLTCHAGFEPRGAHTSHGLSCDRCHHEHQGGRDKLAADLGARNTCAGCHPAIHEAEWAAPLPAGVKVAAGSLVDAAHDQKLDIVAMHERHARAKVGGADAGIGCTSCHSSFDAAGAPSKGVPGLACFRCHGRGPASEANRLCSNVNCHGGEHGHALARMDVAAAGRQQVLAPPTALGSGGWALGLGLLGLVPALVFGGVVRSRRRRSAVAMVEELHATPAEVVKRLVHSINDSKCVGCAMCVQACPASVLELVGHKSRVVNFDACIQCKRCEQACAFDALRMHDADKPPPMIPMPSVDGFHETPVAGMYLIGQASGVPQVKNATNLGRAIVQRLVQTGFAPGAGAKVGAEVDVVICGSGPAGLSAALTCIELGLSYVVLEKEREFAWTIRNYYHKGKEVMAEPNDVGLEATLPHWDSTREELLGAWAELVAQHQVAIRYQQPVLDVKKDGEKFVVTVGDGKGQPAGQVTGARVVLAIGTLGNPRKLGCAGDDLEKVKNSLVDPEAWTGQKILIVGGSDSAVEVILALSRPELKNEVTFSTRGAKLEGIKPKNRKLYEDALAAGRFAVKYATAVAEVTATTASVTYMTDQRREDFANDVVFALIGGNSPQKWLQGLGVPYVDRPHSWSPPRTDLLSQKTGEGLVQLRRLPRRELPKRDPHH